MQQVNIHTAKNQLPKLIKDPFDLRREASIPKILQQ